MPALPSSRPPTGRKIGRPSTAQSQQTEARILQAARNEFQRNGYARASVESVADAAGITRASIYRHYADKEGLLRAAIQSAADEASERTTSATTGIQDPVEALRRMALAFALESLRPHALSGFRMLIAEAAHFPTLHADMIVTMMARQRAQLDTLIEAAQAQGQLGSAWPVKTLRTVLLRLVVDGPFAEAMYRSRAETLSDQLIRREFAQMWQVFLAVVRSAPSARAPGRETSRADAAAPRRRAQDRRP